MAKSCMGQFCCDTNFSREVSSAMFHIAGTAHQRFSSHSARLVITTRCCALRLQVTGSVDFFFFCLPHSPPAVSSTHPSFPPIIPPPTIHSHYHIFILFLLILLMLLLCFFTYQFSSSPPSLHTSTVLYPYRFSYVNNFLLLLALLYLYILFLILLTVMLTSYCVFRRPRVFIYKRPRN